MNSTGKIKEFDCLEFKDNAQEKIYKTIRNFSSEQEINYFSEKVKQGSFKDLVNRLQFAHPSA